MVLCPEVATGQAREAQRPVEEELEMLCTHGILHLLGFDHAEPGDRATMFGLQDRLLASWRAERVPGRLPAGEAKVGSSNLETFGMKAKGHIGLQDHGASVMFRNVKIRVLGKE